MVATGTLAQLPFHKTIHSHSCDLQRALNKVVSGSRAGGKMASFRQTVRRFATYAERLQAKQTAAEGEFLYLRCSYSPVYFISIRRKITIETLYDFGNLPV